MDISSHPLKDPSLRIPVVAYDMKSGVELKQQFFIPVLLVDNKREQANITKTVKSFFKARKSSNGISTHALVREGPVLVLQDARVIALLLVAPEPVRGNLGLLVRILGLVQECDVLSEA